MSLPVTLGKPATAAFASNDQVANNINNHANINVNKNATDKAADNAKFSTANVEDNVAHSAENSVVDHLAKQEQLQRDASSLPPSHGLVNLSQLPTQPTNVILTGVAGTGKTHQLLQLQRLYDQTLETAEPMLWQTLLTQVGWREVVCAVLLIEEQALRVAEITAHPLFQQKAQANGRRDNLAQTAWGVLLPYSSADSETVNFSGSNRASTAYFDQTSDKAWYLLEEVKADLASRSPISELLALYRQQTAAPQSSTELGLGRGMHLGWSQTMPQSATVSRSCLVSFHQAYGYEEFVEGIRPMVGTQGHISYQIQAGAFLRLCQKAAQDPQHRYAMLIDEINRANVARVFGELMSLIEPDKRAGQANAMQVSLAYSGRGFSVPSNVDIYATMNTQDQSLAPLDMAFRRRFQFIDCPPNPALLPVLELASADKYGTAADEAATEVAQSTPQRIELARILAGLNQRICQVLGQDGRLGHAFFMGISNLAELQAVLVQQVIPQLAQATGGQLELLHYIFNEAQQPPQRQFIHNQPLLLETQQAHPAMTDSSRAGYALETASLAHPLMGNSANYWINPDLLSLTGAFAHAQVYQQLY